MGCGGGRGGDPHARGLVASALHPVLSRVGIRRSRARRALLWWVVNLYVCECLLFTLYAATCRFPPVKLEEPISDASKVTVGRVAVATDPQLTDGYSYKWKPGLKLWLTQFYSDVYMRKAYTRVVWKRPNALFLLGDLLDGGRTWDDDEWAVEFDRFRHVFWGYDDPVSTCPHYAVPGNHDIGLGSFANPNALARFERHFNKVNFVTEVAGITYVGVNTVAFAAGPSRAQMAGKDGGDPEPSPYVAMRNEAANFVYNVSAVLGAKPKILLTHIPLYRPSEMSCGKNRRHSASIRQGRGISYQNLIDERSSFELLQRFKPLLHVFSGDDHDNCEVYHGAVPETTVATFSWLQGNYYPGFALLTTFIAEDGLTLANVRLCPLPPQIWIYAWYGVAAALTVAYLACGGALAACWWACVACLMNDGGYQTDRLRRNDKPGSSTHRGGGGGGGGAFHIDNGGGGIAVGYGGGSVRRRGDDDATGAVPGGGGGGGGGSSAKRLKSKDSSVSGDGIVAAPSPSEPHHHLVGSLAIGGHGIGGANRAGGGGGGMLPLRRAPAMGGESQMRTASQDRDGCSPGQVGREVLTLIGLLVPVHVALNLWEYYL